MDPSLHSIHLEADPRREAFRAARARLADAQGQHTLAGQMRSPLEARDPFQQTITPSELPLATPSSQVVAWLLDRGRHLPLYVGTNTIGRLPDNTVVMQDACVSRRHCAILIHSDLTCELHDIASKNGTLHNGRKITAPTRLEEGDEITMSERRLRFSRSGPAEASAPKAGMHSEAPLDPYPPHPEEHTLAG